MSEKEPIKRYYAYAHGNSKFTAKEGEMGAYVLYDDYAKEVSALKHDLERSVKRAAEAEALVYSHEGRIARLQEDVEKLRGFAYWVICNARKGGIHGETIMKRANGSGVIELFDSSEAATKLLTGEENG